MSSDAHFPQVLFWGFRGVSQHSCQNNNRAYILYSNNKQLTAECIDDYEYAFLLLQCGRQVCISMRGSELCIWPSIGEKFIGGVFQIHSNHPEASPLATVIISREYIVALWLKSIVYKECVS